MHIMKLTSSPQPTRKPFFTRFAQRAPISITLLAKSVLGIGVLGLLVALPMLPTVDIRAADGQSTLPSALGTKTPPEQKVLQFAAASATEARPTDAKKVKLGIVIYSTDAETVWNAFRFGVFALKQGDSVKVFLLAKGVDCEKLNTEEFNVTGQMRTFADAGGTILACGTCLKLRQSGGTELCRISSMQEMYDIVKGSDKVLTF
jgi:uncharacterized protein involved in oxidation of intracellular sulfur